MDLSDTDLGFTMAHQLQLAIVNSCLVMSYLKYLNTSPAPSCLIQSLNHYLALIIRRVLTCFLFASYVKEDKFQYNVQLLQYPRI